MPEFEFDLRRDRFLPLPDCDGVPGTHRRVGIEFEFTGLTELQAAEIAAATLGGEVRVADTFNVKVEGSAIGDIAVKLDTSLAKPDPGVLVGAGLGLSRGVIPTELITDPLPQDRLPIVEELRLALARAGAEGSRSGMLRGFGLHLNPEVAGATSQCVVPVLRAFALVEDWLREADPMDSARRLLPFVDPYPSDLVDSLAHGVNLGRDEAFATFLGRTRSRNFGLDILPLIAAIGRPDLASIARSGERIRPRPAWHYRLPDCRIDEADWTVAYEWNRWVMVERVANDRALLDELALEWQSRRDALTAVRMNWWRQVNRLLRATGSEAA